ncbi:SIS domain-containing protein [Devosia sp.]|uniref:D-sedoheptulose-7-phosphate isomerase n=1 Tax=Devosia sp. TaxID=1871048 RepID=UPI003265329E
MAIDAGDKLQSEISELISVLSAAHVALAKPLDSASQLLIKAFAAGNKLLIAGNGGSAAEAQHMAAEYAATLDHRNARKGFPAIALTTDTSFLTAWSNDFGFETVFARQIQALGRKGDVLMVYSTSGNSKNIVRAVREAKAMGLIVIGFTGGTGGALAELCDVALVVPSTTTQRIQEIHCLIGHTLCSLVEQQLTTFGDIGLDGI